MSNVECRCCKNNTEKRVVVKRFPLKKTCINLLEGYEEFYCSNIIRTKKKGRDIYEWITEECRNHILIIIHYPKEKIEEVSS